MAPANKKRQAMASKASMIMPPMAETKLAANPISATRRHRMPAKTS